MDGGDRTHVRPGLDRLVPVRANAWLTAFVLGGGAAILVLAPRAWAAGWLAFGILLAAFAYLSFLNWLLIHEAIHVKLARTRRVNDLLGRALAIAFGCPMHILKVGHMAHHRYNRGALDTTEFMPGDARHPALWWLYHYGKILGGLYIAEVLVPLVFFFWSRLTRLSAVRRRADTMALLALFTPRMVNTIRIDAVLCLSLLCVLGVAFAADPVPLLLLYGARALIISFHDNLYHYGTAEHDIHAARNLSAPRWLSPFMLNHHLHSAHHDLPAVSWAALPQVFARQARGYDGGFLDTGLLQLKGPVRSAALSAHSNRRPDGPAA